MTAFKNIVTNWFISTIQHTNLLKKEEWFGCALKCITFKIRYHLQPKQKIFTGLMIGLHPYSFIQKQKANSIASLFILVITGFTNFATAQTTPNFTINKTSGCVPLSGVNFTDASTGGSEKRSGAGVAAGRSWASGAAGTSKTVATAKPAKLRQRDR